MIIFAYEFETTTMFFETSEEALKFFFNFKKNLIVFNDLQQKKLHLFFTVKPNLSKLKFVWIFQDEEKYQLFNGAFNKSDFIFLTHKLGWKQIKRSSFNF